MFVLILQKVVLIPGVVAKWSKVLTAVPWSLMV